jgi:hypothetical protein
MVPTCASQITSSSSTFLSDQHDIFCILGCGFSCALYAHLSFVLYIPFLFSSFMRSRGSAFSLPRTHKTGEEKMRRIGQSEIKWIESKKVCDQVLKMRHVCPTKKAEELTVL